ncbi:MAG: uracil phosphoribosyltransferase [Bacteroidetes bacterium]|nr:MAG: uracil phosphoribosyltransferase [Bacteroidota bacterium]
MLTIITHPLVQHKLTRLRNRDAGMKEFRESLVEITTLMAYEIFRELPLAEVMVETPMEACTGRKLSRSTVVVPILRAGLGMVEGITRLIPDASVGHIGLYRDHDSLEPVQYYNRLPENLQEAVVILLDPMLATGGSASRAITRLKESGAGEIKLVCIVGAPEGVGKVEKDHPDVDIYMAALDRGLNDTGYILPGLGDAGDRLFGTT